MVETIKNNISILDVCSKYNIKLNRANFAKCPKHKDRTPSMKIYSDNNSWHCFSCNNGGDVISLVQAIYDIDFKTAVAQINNDFNLNINLYHKPSKSDLKRIMEQRDKKIRKEKQLENRILFLCDLHRKFYNTIEKLKEETHRYNWEEKTSLIAKWQIELEKIDYKIEVLREWNLENIKKTS